MEPSGVMDGGSWRLDKQDSLAKNGYSVVCDIADEEVHFSRDMFTRGQQQAHYSAANNTDQHQYQQQDNPYHYHQLHPSATNFTDINLNHSQQHHYGPVQSNETSAASSADRAKSSKLLNSIGSRLRRGSNYLVAPKLVGQYLLGITIQSWSEFLNTSRMMRAPSNTNQLARRLLTNLTYFQGNYLCVSLILVIYCILTSPLLLLAIIAYLISLYLVTARSATGRHLRIAGYRPNLQQQYSFLTLISLPLLWVAGAPSAVFWVIGASFVVVGLHASMYSNDRQLANEPNGPATATFSIGDHQIGQSKSHTRVSTVQYYNHYPVQTSPQTQYLSLPSSSTGNEQSAKESTSFPYTQYAIPHWMMFGGGSSKPQTGSTNAHANPNPTNSGSAQLASGSSSKQSRLPQVNIISQDYAGLGRVYEV